MGFNFGNAATTAASNFINKKLENVNLANGVSSALGKASEIANGLLNNLTNGIDVTGGASSLKPKPGTVAEEVNNNAALDINGILENGKDLAQIPRKPGEAFPNDLSQFDSYNCLWTLSVLSANAINFPDDTYRKGILGPILVKSGGTGGVPDDQVVKLNNFKSTTDPKSNPKGIYDAFIDNVKISGVIGFNRASGNTNATMLSFNITEPYSVGLFFQNVQVAAWEAGWLNWLDMPMLLSLEFKGHLTANRQNFSAPLAKKHIPFKLHQISMRITGEGCVYDCQAHPWNEQGFSTDSNRFKTDLTIEGGTVQQMLQTGTKDNKKSLQNVVNISNDERANKAGVEIADRILILFPIDGQTGKDVDKGDDNSDPMGATKPKKTMTNKEANQAVYKRLSVSLDAGILSQKEADVNPIGLSKMGFGEDLKKVEKAMGKDNVVYDQKTGTYTRGDLAISKTIGEAKFKNETSVVDAINQIILASDYGRKALDEDNIKDEKVNWWKIETQVYILPTDKPLKKQQRYPTLTVFRVIPYKIDYKNFLPADQRPPPKRVEEQKKNAIKKYDYLYTGKNTDILEFNINFDSSFYMALNADSGKNNESAQQNGNKTTKDEPEQGKKTDIQRDEYGQLVAAPPPNNGASGMASTSPIIKNTELHMGATMGGPLGDDPSTIAARQFQRAMNTGPNMISLDMKILGDPYYLGDSGMGNYTAQSTNIPEMNADGAINNQDGEVYILVNFRNPIDINVDSGFYEFGQGKVVPQFSGLYRVIKTESQFNKNLFTQQLTLVRMNNQDFKENGDGNGDTNAVANGLFTQQ